MSTKKESVIHSKPASAYRFAELAKRGEVVFHVQDLANLWGIINKNTLYTTLKRYVQQGLLFRIYKGLYSIKPQSEINPELLGVKALHEYCYISTETILIEAGIMHQAIEAITLVASRPKRWMMNSQWYRARQLKDRFLYHPLGVYETGGGVKKASLERAVADLLYFNPRASIDEAESVDWKKVVEMQKVIGYPLRTNNLKL